MNIPAIPMDTLKSLVLRNIDQLEYVIDQLGGGPWGVPEDLIDFIEGIKKMQYKALNEHLPVGIDEYLGELRVLPEAAYIYDDGSPVIELFQSETLTSRYYPRYDGDRETFKQRHLEAVKQFNKQCNNDSTYEPAKERHLTLVATEPPHDPEGGPSA